MGDFSTKTHPLRTALIKVEKLITLIADVLFGSSHFYPALAPVAQNFSLDVKNKKSLAFRFIIAKLIVQKKKKNHKIKQY